MMISMTKFRSDVKYLSVCSGIEAATVAWHPLGWQPVAFSEIEKFPSQVLAHHYPDVPNFGDMTKFQEWKHESIDLLVGGTPCQSFSVAGLRKGLADPRGNLMLTYLAIAERYRPQWLVWENVTGVLSSNGGRDFGAFLAALAECGYGFAYRVVDAQYFGVAQRRRRVFVVGHFGDWRRAAAVLFERESLSGHPAPSREARKRIAPTVTNGPPFSRTGNDSLFPGNWIGRAPENGGNATEPMKNIAPCLTKTDRHGVAQPTAFAQNTRDEVRYINGDGAIAGALAAESGMKQTTYVAQPMAFDWQSGGDARGLDPKPTAQLQRSQTPAVMVAQSVATHDVAETMLSRNTSDGFSSSIDHAAAGYMAIQEMAVRRLMPVEWERLQGFPDGYTDIKPNGKETPDGPRYKALGNSMAVPVMRWIGQRIQMVEDLCKK